MSLANTLALLEQQSRQYLRDDFDTALDELRTNTEECLEAVVHLVECRAEVVAVAAHLRECEYTDPDDCADMRHNPDATECSTCATEDVEIAAWSKGSDGGRFDTHSFAQLFETIHTLLSITRDDLP